MGENIGQQLDHKNYKEWPKNPLLPVSKSFICGDPRQEGTRRAISLRNRNLRAIGETSSGRGPGRSRKKGVLFSPLPNKKTRPFLQNDNKSQAPQSMDQEPNIQNGISDFGHKAVTPQLLHGRNRFEGCLLPYPDAPRVPKIPEGSPIHPGRPQAFSIHSSSVWHLHSAKDFYKSNSGNDSFPSNPQCDYGALLGRFSGHWQFRTSLRTSGREDNRDPAKTGLDGKLKKIKTSTPKETNVSRFRLGLRPSSLSLAREKTREGERNDPYGNTASSHDPKKGNVPVGHANSLYPSGQLGTVSYPTTAGGNLVSPETIERAFRREAGTFRKGERLSHLVARRHKFNRGNFVAQARVRCNIDGRKLLGMGGTPERTYGPRVLESHRAESFLQLKRVESDKQGPRGIHSQITGSKRPNYVRQQGGSGVCQPPGRDKVKLPNGRSQKNLPQSRATPSLPDSPAYQRDRKCSSRLFKPQQVKTGRVGLESCNIPEDSTVMGTASNRPLCHQKQPASEKVLLIKPRGKPVGSGRSTNPVAVQPELCLSPSSVNPGSSKKDKRRASQSNPHSPVLAEKTVVFSTTNDVSLGPVGTAKDSRFVSSGADIPQTSQGAPSDGVEFERSLLRDKGFSPGLVTTLMKSRKPITTNIYGRTWKKFLQFLGKPLGQEPPIESILEFLQAGLQLGLAVNTLKVQVSALGALYNCNIAANRWVARFIKSCHRSRPVSLPKIAPWDLNLVLEALTKEPFEPIQQISTKNLTLKTIILVALTSARRVSDLQALSVNPPYTQIYQDRVVMRTDPA
ncbi:leucine-rich repeat-containing protein 4C isoform X1 [Dendrobates tinctorius]|uniref:leucine-rich repeat-containing protein 4C isoform X1 n=1 Tax=Dendrobates tinctorius TaxID=92724 RepID=UPI003CC93E8D